MCIRDRFRTADFRPRKLKSYGASSTCARGNAMASGFPSLDTLSIFGPPGYPSPIARATLDVYKRQRVFSQGSTCLDLLWIPPCQSTFHLRGFHPLWPAFPGRSVKSFGSIPRSEPRSARTPVWALPVSLAATSRITCCFLFLRLLRCFSSPGSPPNVMYWR